MKVISNNLKSFFCILMCFLLVWGTVCFGKTPARLIQSALTDGGKGTTELSCEPVNKQVLVTGYGGGSYSDYATGNTPTDIEELKKEAKALYKNYKKSGDIQETNLGATGETIVYGNVTLNNKTDESVSIKKFLSEKADLGKITKDKPYILVYHTHSTEGYEMLDLGWYSDQYISRTEDKNKNIIRVGDELVKTLENAGFSVIHDRNIYDKAYNGSYDRSRVSVEKYLKKYPSIVVTIDVHRDAIHYDDGTKCKPTAQINGKKAAQVMIISGCEGDGVTGFSGWKNNLTFALGLHNTAESKFKTLMRPIFFCNRKYNMDVTPCSLLLEFGTDANTLEEAVYSARLIGESLSDYLNKNIG